VSSQKQTQEPGKSDQTAAENKAPADLEAIEAQAGLEALPGSLAALTGGASPEGPPSPLVNRRLQRAQRQAMARQIGKLMGNESLQRVIRQQGQGGKTSPSEAHTPPRSTVGPASVTETKLPGGQFRQVSRMRFTQVIARTETDEAESQGEGAEQEEPILVREIRPTEEVEESSLDNSISSTLTHRPSVAHSGAGPSGYGVTRSSLRFANVNISPSIGTLVGSGTYTVTGDLVHEITWQVRGGTGPASEVDIQSDSDPDIKACNYQLVAKDLTPNMGDLNGRPPRSNYWAQDLTIRHEQFHAEQRRASFGPASVRAMENWLNAQTATSASQVETTLLPQAMNEGITVFNAMVAAPSTEGDAYGDGAPLYLARANSIKAKGDGGGYGQVSARVTVHPRGGETYTVVAGDSLWRIAERVYGSGRYWPQIRDANPDKVREGGNLIFPGTTLDLPAINVDQQVMVSLASGTTIYLTETVLVPGGGSHEFFVAAKDIFSDTTDVGTSVTTDVVDAGGSTLLSGTWILPGQAVTDDGKYALTTRIAP
jgi:hypothetical protein